MDKGELSKLYFKEGYNCSQAVVLAFKDQINIDEEALKKLSIGFGGGLARQRLVCGAVSGMTIVLSYLISDGKDKLSIYKIIQEACAEFKQEVGSLICAELLDGISAKDTSPIPSDRTKEYYQKRPCAELCALAAEIAIKFIENK